MAGREAKKQRVRERILREARRLMIDRGLERTSVEDIASAAEGSRATLFNYFRGKPAIVEALAASMEPRLVEVVRHYANQPVSTRLQLQQLFAHTARVVAGSGTLNRDLFVCASQGLVMAELQRGLDELLIAGQQRGDVSRDANLPLLSHHIYLALVAGILGWDVDSEKSAAEQAEMRIAWLCEQGLS